MLCSSCETGAAPAHLGHPAMTLQAAHRPPLAALPVAPPLAPPLLPSTMPPASATTHLELRLYCILSAQPKAGLQLTGLPWARQREVGASRWLLLRSAASCRCCPPPLPLPPAPWRPPYPRRYTRRCDSSAIEQPGVLHGERRAARVGTHRAGGGLVHAFCAACSTTW